MCGSRKLQAVVACPDHALRRVLPVMGTKSREADARLSIQANRLVALRTTKISASDPPSTWWPGER
jgi:hypothetical protein